MSIVRLNGSNLGLIKDEVKDGEGYSTPVADDKIAKNMEVIEHSAEKAKVTKAMKMPISEPTPPQLTGDEDDIQKMADGIGKSGTTTIKRAEEKKEEPKSVEVDELKEESEQKAKNVDESIHKAAKTFVDEFMKPDGEIPDKEDTSWEEDVEDSDVGVVQASEGVYRLIDRMITTIRKRTSPGASDAELVDVIYDIDDVTLRDCMHICDNGDYIAKLLVLEYRYRSQDTTFTPLRAEGIYRDAIVKYYDLGALRLKEMDIAINTVMKVLMKGLR